MLIFRVFSETGKYKCISEISGTGCDKFIVKIIAVILRK